MRSKFRIYFAYRDHDVIRGILARWVDSVPVRDGCGGAELALVSRAGGVGCGRWAKASRDVGYCEGHQHCVEDADSGAGAFQPDCVGRSRLRHDRGEQPAGRRVPARDLWRRRCVRRSQRTEVAGPVPECANGRRAVGPAGGRRCAEGEAPHQVDLRELDAGDGGRGGGGVLRVAGFARVRSRRQAVVDAGSGANRCGRLRSAGLRVGGRRARRFCIAT